MVKEHRVASPKLNNKTKHNVDKLKKKHHIFGSATPKRKRPLTDGLNNDIVTIPSRNITTTTTTTTKQHAEELKHNQRSFSTSLLTSQLHTSTTSTTTTTHAKEYTVGKRNKTSQNTPFSLGNAPYETSSPQALSPLHSPVQHNRKALFSTKRRMKKHHFNDQVMPHEALLHAPHGLKAQFSPFDMIFHQHQYSQQTPHTLQKAHITTNTQHNSSSSSFSTPHGVGKARKAHNNDNAATTATTTSTLPTQKQRIRGPLHYKLLEVIPKLQKQLREFSTQHQNIQQEQNNTNNGNTTANNTTENQQQQQQTKKDPNPKYRKSSRNSGYNRMLSNISRFSAAMRPKLTRTAMFFKTGCIMLATPVMKPTKYIAAELAELVSPPIDSIGRAFHGMMDWVDQQIAKRENIPADQIASIRTQVIAIAANSIVCLSKAIAAYVSNSGVMLAEALHSLADLSNQSLLLFGTSKALKHSDDLHPYGYATAKYIYGMLSASGVFFISCALTLYHAVAQYFDDAHAVEVSLLTVAVLGISAVVEGYSQWTAYNTIKQLAEEDDMTFSEYIKKGSDTSSIAVFVEDSIALVGLGIAITSTALTHYYQSNLFDTLGTGAIGLSMGFVAYFLFHRNESFVLGTSLTLQERGEILDALRTRPAVLAVHDLKAVHYGDADTRVKAELAFNGTVIAKQALDESRLVHVNVPLYTPDVQLAGKDGEVGMGPKDHGVNTPQQSMLFGPDGTIAGNQIVHLLQRTGLSHVDATNLLLRYGSECVQEVARETDQVEKCARAEYPEITHLDLECHSASPLDDFQSENFVYPYLEQFKRQEQQVASQKRLRKSRAWSRTKTGFLSLTQAMKGEHHLKENQDMDGEDDAIYNMDLNQHTLTPDDSLSEVKSVIQSSPTAQQPQRKGKYHVGKYEAPVDAKELVNNEMFTELLSLYQTKHGLPYIDQSMTLFPYDDAPTAKEGGEDQWRFHGDTVDLEALKKVEDLGELPADILGGNSSSNNNNNNVVSNNTTTEKM